MRVKAPDGTVHHLVPLLREGVPDQNVDPDMSMRIENGQPVKKLEEAKFEGIEDGTIYVVSKFNEDRD